MELIAATNDCSSVSKASMAASGYIRDPFAPLLVKKFKKRAPLIHRGYFIRVWVINEAVNRFIDFCAQKQLRAQIVNLGAGFDSLYFRLLCDKPKCDVVFVEVDQPDVVEQKYRLIMENADGLKLDRVEVLSESSPFHVRVGNFHLVSCDLRDLKAFETVVQQCFLDQSLPSLFIAECVLNYLEPNESNSLLQGISSNFAFSCCLLYEQVQPFTAFGCFMRNHFVNRGSKLRSICHYPTVRSQEERLQNLGWKYSLSPSMNWFYYHVMSLEKRLEVQMLEPFDEFELFDILNSHYCVVCGASNEVLRAVLIEEFCQQTAYINWRLQHDDAFTTSASPGICAGLTSLAIEEETLSSEAQRFAHCVTAVSGNFFLITGGTCHRRCTNTLVLELTKDVVTARNLGGLSVERLYASITVLQDDGLCLVFGGRLSPNGPLLKPLLLRLDLEKLRGEEEAFPIADNAAVCYRWRHAAALIQLTLLKYVIVCGGLTSNGQILHDCWRIDVADGSLTQLAELPVPLHSHRCCVWKSSRLVVSGGLNASGVLSAVYTYDIVENVWSVLEIDSSVIPRYGHSAHIVDDDLILLGGCCQLDAVFPVISVVNLNTGSVRNVTTQTHCPILLVNHDSVVHTVDYSRKKSVELLVFGGGGNCFSFGTLLNPVVSKIVFELDH